MSAIQVISKKNRIKIGIASVLIFNVLFIIGLYKLKAGKPIGDKMVAIDLYADTGTNGLAFYEALPDTHCAKVLNEQTPKPATEIKVVTPADKKAEDKTPTTTIVQEPAFQYAGAPTCVKPTIAPEGSAKLGKDGFVGLQINISKTGKVERGEVDRSSGIAELDQAALKQVVENWNFAPCKKGDVTVACKQYIKFRWKNDVK